MYVCCISIIMYTVCRVYSAALAFRCICIFFVHVYCILCIYTLIYAYLHVLFIHMLFPTLSYPTLYTLSYTCSIPLHIYIGEFTSGSENDLLLSQIIGQFNIYYILYTYRYILYTYMYCVCKYVLNCSLTYFALVLYTLYPYTHTYTTVVYN